MPPGCDQHACRRRRDRGELTEEFETEAIRVEERIGAIKGNIKDRARCNKKDYAIGGCIVTIGRDGKTRSDMTSSVNLWF